MSTETIDATEEDYLPPVRTQINYLPSDLRIVEAARNHYVLIAPMSWTLANVKVPSALWMAGNRKVNKGDVVEIQHVTGEWLVQLFVTKIDLETQSIFTRVLMEHDWTRVPEQAADMRDARYEWKGPELRYVVIIGSQIVKSGLDTEVDAMAWIDRRGGTAAKKAPPAKTARAPGGKFTAEAKAD